jgi:hypothetical protein
MSKVVTKASTVRCGELTGGKHGGTVSTSSSNKLTVNGSAVLTADGVSGKSVVGCQTPTSNSTQPCKNVGSVMSGLASKLTTGGKPVVLEGVAGATDGVPPGGLAADASQNKLTAS